MKNLLQLMQLSDSAVPIGAAAHSFGLEGLVEAEGVSPDTLTQFVTTFLQEQGLLEACFCRAAYDAGRRHDDVRELCFAMGALKPARESRDGSTTLGRRLLGMVTALLDEQDAETLQYAFSANDPHHAVVFGYTAALLAIEIETAVGAFLHQTVTTIVSSAQRLLPVGQRQAASVLWQVKDEIVACAASSREESVETVQSFLPELEIASMRHPNLETRLFLS